MSILGNVQRVLLLFAEGTDDLSFTEAAARLDLPKSSASHLLNQMTRYGLLDQHANSRRYRPGALLGRAARTAYAATPLDDACRETLLQISSESGLTAYLSALNGAETVVLQRLNGDTPVQVLSSPGSRRAAPGTAMGRALLSRLTPAEIGALYGTDTAMPLPATGQSGLADVGALMQCLTQVRHVRHAMVVDSAMPGIGAIAAAVRNPRDGELRGLCLSFAAGRQADTAQTQAWRRLVLDAVGTLGRRIGDPVWLSASDADAP